MNHYNPNDRSPMDEEAKQRAEKRHRFDFDAALDAVERRIRDKTPSDLEALKALLAGAISIRVPRDFDPERYMERNADVTKAVSRGEFASAQQHYACFGAWEWRPASRHDEPQSVGSGPTVYLPVLPSSIRNRKDAVYCVLWAEAVRRRRQSGDVRLVVLPDDDLTSADRRRVANWLMPLRAVLPSFTGLVDLPTLADLAIFEQQYDQSVEPPAGWTYIERLSWRTLWMAADDDLMLAVPAFPFAADNFTLGFVDAWLRHRGLAGHDYVVVNLSAPEEDRDGYLAFVQSVLERLGGQRIIVVPAEPDLAAAILDACPDAIVCREAAVNSEFRVGLYMEADLVLCGDDADGLLVMSTRQTRAVVYRPSVNDGYEATYERMVFSDRLHRFADPGEAAKAVGILAEAALTPCLGVTDSTTWLRRRTLRSLRERHYDRARRLGFQALELQPANVETMSVLTEIAGTVGHLEEQMAWRLAQLTQQPSNVHFFLAMGELAVELGELDLAIRIGGLIHLLHPHDYKANLIIARAALIKFDLELAAKKTQWLCLTNHGDPFRHMAHGICLRYQNDPASREAFRKAEELVDRAEANGLHPLEADQMRARISMAAGQGDEACRTLVNSYRAHHARYGRPVIPEAARRMADIIRDRDVAILALGPSLAKAPMVRAFFAMPSVCTMAINRPFLIEEKLLGPAGRALDIAVMTPARLVGIHAREVLDFVGRDMSNLFVTTQNSLNALGIDSRFSALCEQLMEERILAVDTHNDLMLDPRHPGRMMNLNSMTMAVPLAMLGGARRIFLFGADGHFVPAQAESHFAEADPKFHAKVNSPNARYLVEAEEFSQVVPLMLSGISEMFDIPQPKIYVVNPHSNYRVGERISYESLAAALAQKG